MIKIKNLCLLVFSLLLTLHSSISPIYASINTINDSLPCSCEDSNDPACELEHKRHDTHKKNFWSDENISLLNENEKANLSKLQEKINKGEVLNDDERKLMIELKDVVAKSKLGEKDFESFKKLIEKKKSGKELTQDECEKLKSYLKKIR